MNRTLCLPSCLLSHQGSVYWWLQVALLPRHWDWLAWDNKRDIPEHQPVLQRAHSTCLIMSTTVLTINKKAATGKYFILASTDSDTSRINCFSLHPQSPGRLPIVLELCLVWWSAGRDKCAVQIRYILKFKQEHSERNPPWLRQIITPVLPVFTIWRVSIFWFGNQTRIRAQTCNFISLSNSSLNFSLTTSVQCCSFSSLQYVVISCDHQARAPGYSCNHSCSCS